MFRKLFWDKKNFLWVQEKQNQPAIWLNKIFHLEPECDYVVGLDFWFSQSKK